MFKRILIALVLIISLQAIISWVPSAYAEDDPAAPPPGESLESEYFMFDLGAITHEDITGSTRQGWIRRGINYFFERVIGFLAAVIGSLAVLMLMVGGFLMLSSGGDETMYNKGKGYAKYSLIGLAVTLLAYVMVALVQLLIKSIYG